jgi:hypothetical protein
MAVIEKSHKSLIVLASVIVKVFLMTIISTQVFCGSATPSAFFFGCGTNIGYVAGSIAAVAMLGSMFGYYIIRLRSFDAIFVNMMKMDFFVTAMYFAVSFASPAEVTTKVMVWLFGMWILGMLLAPFDSHRTVLKKIIGYGSLIALGGLLTAHLVPGFDAYVESYSTGIVVSSILAVFGGGRAR